MLAQTWTVGVISGSGGNFDNLSYKQLVDFDVHCIITININYRIVKIHTTTRNLPYSPRLDAALSKRTGKTTPQNRIAKEGADNAKKGGADLRRKKCFARSL